MNYQIVMAQLPLVRETTAAQCRTPTDVALLFADIATLAQETFQIVTLNARNKVLNRHMVTLGLASASLVHPREVFRPAISDGAAAIIIVHNHPSGDNTPSAEDIRITRQLVEAGKIIDIKVLDHVIIGRETAGTVTAYSMRESGLVDFT